MFVCGAAYVSGKEVMTLELLRGLKQTPIETHAITSVWNNGDFIRALDEMGVGHTQMPLGFISATLRWSPMKMTADQILRWPLLLRRYRRALKGVAPDVVVHTNWHHLIVLLPFLRPDRDMFWVHECIQKAPRFAQLFRMLSGRLKVFVAVSHAVADSLMANGVPMSQIVVIHNGIRDTYPADGEVRARQDAVVVGIVGQIIRTKGHEDAVAAFARLAQEIDNVSLHIIGSGDAEFIAGIKDAIEKRKITDRVAWLGYLKREEIFKNIDVCLVPSRAPEALPTVAIEAALWKRPVVATSCGGLPEIIEDRRSGLLCTPGDPESIAIATRKLLLDEDLRKCMGEFARSSAIEKFSAQRFILKFESLLTDAAAAGRKLAAIA